MSLGSLRLRLIAGAAAFVVLALALAAGGLTLLFHRHVQGWAAAEMTTYLDQLVAGIDKGSDGRLEVARPPPDPRFQRALSGLYWQVSIEPDGPILRSRSLWDFVIVQPAGLEADKALNTYEAPGPDKQTLHLVQRRVTLPERLGSAMARVAVAIDNADLIEASRRFGGALIPFLAVLAALLVAAAWAQVSIGLRPLAALRRRLAAIGAGDARRLGGGFPDEVLPLARQFDALLDARERQIEKARTRAADLAHGLKTPLQVLSGEAERLKAQGESERADEIESIVGAMRRHVERELTRARVGADAADASAHVANVAQRVVRVMERTPEGKRVTWTVDVPPALYARIDPDDLTEALGNLAENAARHAQSSVTVVARPKQDAVEVAVIDDGPGIPPKHASEALRRGGRLDQSGSAGLGLAIVGDIAEAWDATLTIEAPSRGCHVSLRLPMARLPRHPGGSV